MASFDRGSKRQCLHCSTKYYDLNRDPILCPSCGKEFVIVTEKPAPTPAPVAAKKAPEAKTEEADVDQAAVAAGAEVISLDDAEDDDDSDDDDVKAAAGVEDVEVDEDVGGEVGDVFLEEEEDGESKIGFGVDTKDEN